MKTEESINLPLEGILPRCSTRTKNILERDGSHIKTLGDLKAALEKDLPRARECGARTLLELSALLEENGITVEFGRVTEYNIRRWKVVSGRKAKTLSKG